MRVAGAESAQNYLPMIGHPLPALVAKMPEFRVLTQVTTARVAIQLQARWNHQAIGENRDLIHVPLVLRILEDQDFVVGRFTGFDLRISLRANHPKAAAGIPADLDRFDHALLLGGKKLRLKTLRQVKRGQFRRRVVEIRFGVKERACHEERRGETGEGGKRAGFLER